MIAVLSDVRHTLMFRIFALVKPNTKRNAMLIAIDHQKAWLVSISMYGERGMRPQIIYETSMMSEAIRELLSFIARFELDSAVSLSERKLPTDIENASTQIKMMPEITISFLSTPADAIPAKSPTVDTKLSSEPKMKFLAYNINVLVAIMCLVYYKLQTFFSMNFSNRIFACGVNSRFIPSLGGNHLYSVCSQFNTISPTDSHV